MVRAACSFAKQDGERCRSFALESGLCFWHDPAHETEAAEARRLGGLRRRKEKAVEGAYEIEGLEDVGQVRRLIEIAALDTLSLENSIARSRTLAYLAGVALKALEAGEFEERLLALEAAVKPREPAKTGRRR
ncbi:MAG: hypothetical protein U1B78_02595 [Dehalococcoidia bacterium]|nr:hypothetical protein [Dehalococcoidia bacterium]MDZ4278008.1 hypothetical protein [Dehalococcoidia bacterium]